RPCGFPSFLTLVKTFIKPPLAAGNLIHPRLMPATLKTRLKKNLHHLIGHFKRNKPCGYGQNIGIIVLSAQCRQLLIPTKGCSNPLVFIGSDGYPVAASTDDDALIRLTLFYDITKWMYIIRIIHRCIRSGHEIFDLIALFGQDIDQPLFVFKAGVITSYCYYFRHLFCFKAQQIPWLFSFLALPLFLFPPHTAQESAWR